MAGGAHDAGRSVLSRAVAVLGAFDQAHRELTATQVAHRSGVPLSTAHRLLVELADHDVVVRRGDRWGVGQRVWALGLLAPVQTGLRDVAAPFLHDVHVTTRATVHLVVRQGAEALFLDRVSGHTALPVVSRAGSLLPLHATGAGKVLLAHAPADVQEQVLAGELARCTPHTVVHPGRLRDQMRRVRESGHATTQGELVPGMSSVAVPISRGTTSDGAREVVAALGVVAPRLDRHRARFLGVLQVAARGIGRQLGPG
jgi:DNA-binding IclR family transcriptional regulator